jgi:biofilm protein TabA
MICDLLVNARNYLGLHPGFAEAFAFLERPELADLADGRYAIAGENVFAIISRDQGRRRDQAQLEAHRRYIDIQLVLAGNDDMGWRPVVLCGNPTTAYDEGDDIAFFVDPPLSWLSVVPGMFAVFFPDDGHLPLISHGVVHKVVVKVAVSAA